LLEVVLSRRLRTEVGAVSIRCGGGVRSEYAAARDNPDRDETDDG